MADKKIALVTGANRGIGFEVARQLAQRGHKVILGARDNEKGKSAAAKLLKEGLDVTSCQLDVTSSESISQAALYIEREFGRLDVLVNNAGILIDKSVDGSWEGASALNAKMDTIRQTIETNVYGPFQLCQKLVPLMRKNGFGRIVNISSGMGALNEMNGGYPGYRISKTALNAITRIFADETDGTGIKVNSACPGWVKTDMGGSGADREPEVAAEGIVWLATLPENGPTGGFFRDKEPIDW